VKKKNFYYSFVFKNLTDYNCGGVIIRNYAYFDIELYQCLADDIISPNYHLYTLLKNDFALLVLPFLFVNWGVDSKMNVP